MPVDTQTGFGKYLQQRLSVVIALVIAYFRLANNAEPVGKEFQYRLCCLRRHRQDNLSARPEDASDLFNHRARKRQVLQHGQHGDDIEALVRERQLVG